jgi:hypothetical protein
VAELGERLGTLRLCEPEAVASMRRSLERHGQLSAVAVFTTDGGTEIIDGFKRLHAARALGWAELRVHALDVDVVGAKLAVGLFHGRTGLTELEEAWLVRSLYRDDGLSQPEIGARQLRQFRRRAATSRRRRSSWSARGCPPGRPRRWSASCSPATPTRSAAG